MQSMEMFQYTKFGRRAFAMLTVTMVMYRARGCALLCCEELKDGMRHAALTCAVLYCIVDQVVLGVRLMTELIWILNSSCLNA